MLFFNGVSLGAYCHTPVLTVDHLHARVCLPELDRGGGCFFDR